MGIMALLGFLAAILIHANLRGEGDIAAGVKSIIEQDVLKRVNGGDLNNFDEVFWPSFNASIWEVVCKYFHFSTEIITGVTGNLFPLLCTVPLGIYVYNFKRNELNWELPVMYAFFFLTAILWYILAKSHSYIHTHINFVLWYFGFIQICIYTICSQIKNIIVKKKGD